MAIHFFNQGLTRTHLGRSGVGVTSSSVAPIHSDVYLDFEHRGDSRLYFRTWEDREVFKDTGCAFRDWEGHCVLDFRAAALGLWLGYPRLAVQSFEAGVQDIGVRCWGMTFTCSHRVLQEVVMDFWRMYGGRIPSCRLEVNSMWEPKTGNRRTTYCRFTQQGVFDFIHKEIPRFLREDFIQPSLPRERGLRQFQYPNMHSL